MKKRLLSVILAALMTVGVIVSAIPAVSAAEMNFKDVKADDWFASAVEYAYVNRIMNGTSADKFSPNAITNRARVITVLWRLEGGPKAGSESSFKDLKDDWYLEAVAWGYEKGLILGYTSQRFAPEEPVTREQLCAILYRYTAFKGGDVSARAKLDAFPDADKVSEYAKDPMAWAVDLGIVTGSKNQGVTVLDPTGSATRAMFAAIMMRYAAK